MKSLVALFAGSLTPHAREPLPRGQSALDRALSWAVSVPDAARVLVFARTGDGPFPAPAGGSAPEVVAAEVWTASSFFSRLERESEGFDHVLVAWADCPFLDGELTRTLLDRHLQYAAEYTFADGYPVGLAPDILARGIVPVLSRLARESETPVSRTAVFEAIKKDINSFDIETELAPTDLRQLRLTLACDLKRNALLCSRLDGITGKNYAEIVAERPDALRTLPAFYNVQVVGRCPQECSYCPYPAFSRSGTGISPGVPATERADFMLAADFAALVAKIAAFSEDAVVSLSLWGEPSLHPDAPELVRAVLMHPGLSVLIETTGLGWKDADLESIARIASAAPTRPGGQNPVNWVVSLDAVGGSCYAAARGIADPARADRDLREGVARVERLLSLFPGAVWPQTVRLNENEAELEAFWRFWKQRAGRVIVQQHDHFCGSIPDRRVADLSPLVRNPCWHLKRDMAILIDGTVPLCREDLYSVHYQGNALKENLADIWANAAARHAQHAHHEYEGLCGSCDEYYTYNF